MEMKVVIRESTMVRPAKKTRTEKLWNSSLDLTAPNLSPPVLYFYRPNGTARNFFNSKLMKDALSRVLVAFYPVAGRYTQGEDGRIVIDCQGQGVLFVEAECDRVLDDFGDFAPSVEFVKLIPMIDYSKGGDSYEYPLFVSQVTYFKCGGVSLGAGLHHRVADGPSVMHIVNTWSEMARGLDITLPPFIDRTLLRARDPPQPVFEHIEYHHDPTMNKPNESKTVCSVFKLTRNQLNALKAKLKETEGNTTSYSTFEILSGHVWKCMCKARELPDNVVTRLDIPVDGRARLHPPLPTGYFGNVIFTATVIATAGNIKSKPSWYATSKIHGALAMMDDDYLKSAVDYLEQHLDHKRDSYKYTNFRINNWARFPIRNADFGQGSPVFMGFAQIPSPGRCYMLPSPINDGSISIIVGLEDEQMKHFRNLFYDCLISCL